LAEFRGSLRDARPTPATSGHETREWLPLGTERTLSEQLVEYTAVIGDLCKELDVQFDAKDLPNAGRNVDKTAAEWLKKAVFDVVVPRATTPSRARILGDVRTFVYSLDAKFQDRFGARDSLSAGYQFGRGVAEIRWGWAFDATSTKSRAARDVLLGEARGIALDRLLTRLAAYYDPVTFEAIESSLASWRSDLAALSAAPEKPWREALIEQATRWRDLILGQRDGASLVSPEDVLSKPASLVPILERLAPEVGLTAFGVALLVVAVAWLATPGGENTIAAVAGTLGIAGVTAAGISAQARARAMNLIDNVRQEIYRDLVAEKAVTRPPASIPAKTVATVDVEASHAATG
jgi:hypothetical protein